MGKKGAGINIAGQFRLDKIHNVHEKGSFVDRGIVHIGAKGKQRTDHLPNTAIIVIRIKTIGVKKRDAGGGIFFLSNPL